mgnify:CR=1 FL=1
MGEVRGKREGFGEGENPIRKGVLSLPKVFFPYSFTEN